MWSPCLIEKKFRALLVKQCVLCQIQSSLLDVDSVLDKRRRRSLLLEQHHRRWTNVKATLGKHLYFTCHGVPVYFSGIIS